MTSRDDEMVGRKGGRTDANGFASPTSHANTPLSPHPARRALCWVSASRLLAIRAAARGIVLTDVEEARAGDGEQVGRGPAGPERVRARVEEGLAVEQGAHDLLEQVLVGRARAVLDRERVVRVDGLKAAAARGRGLSAGTCPGGSQPLSDAAGTSETRAAALRTRWKRERGGGSR